MTKRQRELWWERIRKVFGNEFYERMKTLEFNDEGLGYDIFGAEIESSLIGLYPMYFLFKYWFRVESSGLENVPDSGPLIISPNHSGVLPLDGAMIATDIALHHPAPRLCRAMIDYFFYKLPFVGLVMQRLGQIIGTRKNFDQLLKMKQTVIVFPEGAKGTGKPFKDRYQLLKWNVGFIELSIQHKAPLVPTAVIGGEEQFPMFYDIKPIAKLFGLPYFPITPIFPWLGLAGAVPLPTKYKIRYGEPIRFYEDYPEDVLQNPPVIEEMAKQVRSIVQNMVDEMLAERKGVFSG